MKHWTWQTVMGLLMLGAVLSFPGRPELRSFWNIGRFKRQRRGRKLRPAVVIDAGTEDGIPEK